MSHSLQTNNTSNSFDTAIIPQHVAVIMDGNGRWALSKNLPRYRGHSEGAKAVEQAINAAVRNNIKYLTLFAFSSENVFRPAAEISFLKKLFYKNITERLEELHNNNIKVKFIGDLSFFGEALVAKMIKAENLTSKNTKLVLTIALNYGGRWDIVRACNNIINNIIQNMTNNHQINNNQINNNQINNNQTSNQLPIAITEQDLANNLSTYGLPDPDLLIRTSGEKRISNFLLWQLAYSELYFIDKYWPDFTEHDFKFAIDFFATRQRRFGQAV